MRDSNRRRPVAPARSTAARGNRCPARPEIVVTAESSAIPAGTLSCCGSFASRGAAQELAIALVLVGATATPGSSSQIGAAWLLSERTRQLGRDHPAGCAGVGSRANSICAALGPEPATKIASSG